MHGSVRPGTSPPCPRRPSPAVPIGAIPDPGALSGMAYYIQHPGGNCRLDSETSYVYCPNNTNGRSAAEVFRIFCTSLQTGITIGSGHPVYLRSHMTHKFCRLDSSGRTKALLRCDAVSALAATPFEYSGNTLTYMGKTFLVNGTKEPVCLSSQPSTSPTWSFVLSKARLFSGMTYALLSVPGDAGCQVNGTASNMICDGSYGSNVPERFQVFCNSPSDLSSNMTTGDTFIMKSLKTGMFCQAMLPTVKKLKAPPPAKVVMRLPGVKAVTDLKVVCNVPDADFAGRFTYTGAPAR